MKKTTTTMALFAVLSMMATGCQKENESDQYNPFDTKTGIYTCTAIK